MKLNLLFFLFLLINSTKPAVNSPALKVIDVKAFGAKGDGISDDYQALLKAYQAFNQQGGGTLYFPKGHYLIKAYHQKGTKLANLQIQNCKNVEVKGAGAVIEVFGAFHRPVDYTKGRYSYSYTSSIIPMVIKNCDGVRISGIELRGRADQMTKPKGLTEFGGHLLQFIQCSNVTVFDIYTHHAQTDGIYITDKSRNFRFEHVRSANNARQGMSIIELSDGHFENCSFTGTGFTGGKYGGHNPKAGVDIEPHVNQTVNNILFLKCTFSGNAGSQFVCSRPSTTSGITLDQCTLEAGRGTSPYQLILNVKDLTIKNSTINVGKGSIYPVWGRHAGSDVSIVNCKISGSGKGIVAVSANRANRVRLEGNQMRFTGEKLNSYFPHLQMSNLQFLNNTIDIPSRSIRAGQITSLVQKGEVSSGNRFRSGNQRIPRVSYEGTKKVKDQ